jgi:hypothetical protein
MPFEGVEYQRAAYTIWVGLNSATSILNLS